MLPFLSLSLLLLYIVGWGSEFSMAYALCLLVISVHLDLLRYKLTNKLHFDSANLCIVKQWYLNFLPTADISIDSFILHIFSVSESACLSYFYFYNCSSSTKLCYRNWADLALGPGPATGSSYVEWSGNFGAFFLLVFFFYSILWYQASIIYYNWYGCWWGWGGKLPFPFWVIPELKTTKFVLFGEHY